MWWPRLLEQLQQMSFNVMQYLKKPDNPLGATSFFPTPPAEGRGWCNATVQLQNHQEISNSPYFVTAMGGPSKKGHRYEK